jgi:nucleotide-binding universal stress UspA family protein
LAFSSLGLAGWSAQTVISRGFYALGGAWLPTVLGTSIAVAAAPIHVTLGEELGENGLAIASAIVITVYVSALGALQRVRFKREAAERGVTLRSEAGMLDGALRLGVAAVAAIGVGLLAREQLLQLLPGVGLLALLFRGGALCAFAVALYALLALFNSGRPVFVVPSTHEGPAKLGKAIVCWDGAAQAARAVAESLPSLTATQSVEVLCVQGEQRPPQRPTGAEIVQRLGRHGIASALHEHPAGADVGSAILAYTAESGADYVVMGAYGHWRLRELVFGGTTRTLLASATVPLFMTH